MPKPERIDFYFRCQVGAESRNGILLGYWQSEDAEMPLREMILTAGLAYWLPFAYKHQGSLDTLELKQVVRSSIYQLQLHIAYLKSSFDMEEENYELVPASSNSSAYVKQSQEGADSIKLETTTTKEEQKSTLPSSPLNYLDEDGYDEADELIRQMSRA